MKPPIIVFAKDTEEILLFPSMSEALGYIEAPDIKLYEVYDSTGKVFALSEDRGGFMQSWVKCTDSEKDDPERLTNHLRNQVRKLNLKEPPADSSIELLIKTLRNSGYRNPM